VDCQDSEMGMCKKRITAQEPGNPAAVHGGVASLIGSGTHFPAAILANIPYIDYLPTPSMQSKFWLILIS
jgi:hypothetical protein